MGKQGTTASSFFQVLIVIACGVGLLLYLSGRTPGVLKRGEAAAVRNSSTGKSLFESITKSHEKKDDLDRHDRQELDDLLNKVGK